MVGDDNTHVTSLEKLETNRFETASIKGKRLVLITDSERYGGEVSVLKALTGGDRLPYELKNQQPLQGFQPRAMVMLAANEPFRATDQTSGLERRRLTVPFGRQKPEADRRDLMAEFAPELPGLLRAVLWLPEAEISARIRSPQRYAAKLLDAKFETLQETNPLADWAEHFLTADPEARVFVGVAEPLKGRFENDLFRNERAWLYASYCAFCARNGRRPIALKNFTGNLLDLCQNVLHLPGIDRGKNERGSHFTGLRLKASTTGDGLLSQAKSRALKEADGCPTPESRTDDGTDGNDEFYLINANRAHAHARAQDIPAGVANTHQSRQNGADSAYAPSGDPLWVHQPLSPSGSETGTMPSERPSTQEAVA